MPEAFHCVDCQQLIIVSESEIWRSGKPHIKNYINGRGGQKGDDHLCPLRSGSKFDHTKIPNWEEHYKKIAYCSCPTCGVKYFRSVFNLCPNCYKLKCRSCGRLRNDRAREYRCPACLDPHFDVIDQARYCIIIYPPKEIKE